MTLEEEQQALEMELLNRALTARRTPPQAQDIQAPSTGSDVLQSVPQYAETAISHTVGLPGDVANLATAGLQHFGYAQHQPHYYGSADIQKKLNEYQGGALYQPQTQVGKGLDVAASFAPALVGGPEALLTRAATRVAAPAALTQGIENLPVSEGTKTGLETAAILLTPFAANKVIGGTLNAIKRAAPLSIGNELGVLPTTAQLGATKTELEKILRSPRTTPTMARQANEALAEITNRHEGMKIIEKYTGGARAEYSTSDRYRKGIARLQKDIEDGKIADVFTPGAKAQMAKVVEGGALMRTAGAAKEFGPLHTKGLLTAGGIASYIASFAPTEFRHFILAGVPAFVATAGKIAYPHLTKNQINRLVKLVQKGTKVPGAPSAYVPFQGVSTSPLAPPAALAAQRYSNLQGD